MMYSMISHIVNDNKYAYWVNYAKLKKIELQNSFLLYVKMAMKS